MPVDMHTLNSVASVDAHALHTHAHAHQFTAPGLGEAFGRHNATLASRIVSTRVAGDGVVPVLLMIALHAASNCVVDVYSGACRAH